MMTWRAKYFKVSIINLFQFKHSLRGAPRLAYRVFAEVTISIHAPRRGVRQKTTDNGRGGYDFNPRTPLGVRLDAFNKALSEKAFQSTHPAGGATSASCSGCPPAPDFNPRTPQGVRQQILTKNPSALLSISTKLSKI